MIMSTAIRMESIVKTDGETRVLNGLSLSIEEGTFLTVVGSSGCGKTTLLRILAGLQKPAAGNFPDLSPDQTALLFQDYRLLPWRTAQQQLTDVLPRSRWDEVPQLF